MPKRTLTVMTLAVILTLVTVVPAMAMNDQGNPTREASASNTSTTVKATSRKLAAEKVNATTIRRLRKKTLMYVKATRHRQRVMGVPQSRTPWRELASVDVQSLRQEVNRARKQNWRVLQKYRQPPLLHAWLCIHHYEGAWNDPGSPYWGGLQMDLSFQTMYGGWLLRHKGTADNWTPMEQIWVAVRAWRVKGFSPWPNTASYCGLL